MMVVNRKGAMLIGGRELISHRKGTMKCSTVTCAILAILSTDPQLKPHHVAAIMETIKEESAFDPCIVGGGAHEGLFQFRGPRRNALHTYAGVPMGRCVPAESQVRFMIQELRSRREARDFFATPNCAAAKNIFVRRYEVRENRYPGCHGGVR